MCKPAQELINEKLLSDADILVRVFWTKLGTPTAEYDSGTVEEIERHIEAGRPMLFYFPAEPVALDSVNRDEYGRLVSFKKTCRERGQYHTFDSAAQFAEDYNRHLSMHMNDLMGASAAPAQKAHPLPSQQFSGEAKVLLAEAAKDMPGSVLVIRHINGTDIQTNGKNMVASNERREIAIWEQAATQLVGLKLLVGRGAEGHVFVVTALGYEVADSD